MSSREKLSSELKTAATVALTAAATTFGAPNVNAAESDTEMEAKVEMYSPEASSTNAMGEADLYYGDYDPTNPCNYRNGAEYAVAMGYRYDRELSLGLERPSRDFAGYAGAYVNPNLRPDEQGHIVIVPNDIQRDYHHMGYMNRQEAEYWQMQGGRGYYNQNHHLSYKNTRGPGCGHGYGHGHGGRVGETIREVEHTVREIDQAVHAIGHLFNRGGRR
jgi:hypothetical protein